MFLEAVVTAHGYASLPNETKYLDKPRCMAMYTLCSISRMELVPEIEMTSFKEYVEVVTSKENYDDTCSDLFIHKISSLYKAEEGYLQHIKLFSRYLFNICILHSLTYFIIKDKVTCICHNKEGRYLPISNYT